MGVFVIKGLGEHHGVAKYMKKDSLSKKVFIYKMVGMTGFEPATPWSQTMCSTKLSHIPKYNGAPDRS